MDDKRFKMLAAMAKEFTGRGRRRAGVENFPAERACQVIETLFRELKKLRAVNAEIEKARRLEVAGMAADLKRLRAVKQSVKQSEGAGAALDGWSVQRSGGYHRLFKRIGGRVRGIYLGKTFDREKARAKIAEKLTEWGVPPS